MTIHSNGSKWAGEDVDPVAGLLARLETETLDPSFEDFGGHFYEDEDAPGTWWAFGNFYELSAVFRISSTRDEMAPIGEAIASAKARPEYVRALQAHRGEQARSAFLRGCKRNGNRIGSWQVAR